MEIKMTGIAKAFGTNQVLKDVAITLKAGEVHALMGENGAGKSTLMNILTGLHKADAGVITVDGVATTFANPREAEKNGISLYPSGIKYLAEPQPVGKPLPHATETKRHRHVG